MPFVLMCPTKSKLPVQNAAISPKDSGSQRAASPSNKPYHAESSQAPARYALRRRSSPKGGSPSNISALSATQAKAKARSGPNPLDKLLKEKKLADKRGTGMEALRAAEAVMAQVEKKANAKDNMRAEMDDEDSADDDELWADEEAALRIANQGTDSLELDVSAKGHRSDDSGDSDNEHEDFAVDAATKLLGGDEGKASAVNRILKNDRKGWLGKRRGRKSPKGVSLWATASLVDVPVNTTVPSLPTDDIQLADHPVIKFLGAAVDSNGTYMRSSLKRQLIYS